MRARFVDLLHDTGHFLHGINTTSPVKNNYISAESIPDVLHCIKEMNTRQPVLDYKDITDFGRANFVADPFLYSCDDDLHLLFEVYNRDRTPTASIGHAVSKDEGKNWEYDRIVFEIDRHVSFPYVFEYDSDIYFIPDLSNSNGQVSPVNLYRFHNFPSQYELVSEIINSGNNHMDTVVFQHNGIWWAISGSGSNDQIRIYYSDELTEGEWNPHPDNPVVQNRRSAGRPGGRPIVRDGSIIVFYQDCTDAYGSGLKAYEIKELTPTSYKDRPIFDSPILAGKRGLGWNSGRMHHLDVQIIDDQIFIAFDGDIGHGRSVSKAMWSIGFRRFTLDRPI